VHGHEHISLVKLSDQYRAQIDVIRRAIVRRLNKGLEPRNPRGGHGPALAEGDANKVRLGAEGGRFAVWSLGCLQSSMAFAWTLLCSCGDQIPVAETLGDGEIPADQPQALAKALLAIFQKSTIATADYTRPKRFQGPPIPVSANLLQELDFASAPCEPEDVEFD